MLRKLLLSASLCLIFSSSIFAQTGNISGTITDAKTGDQVPGANIYIKKINKGAASNAKGQYSIKNLSPGTYSLRVSFVGYKTERKSVEVGTGTTTANFALTPDLLGMQDVIVTAQQVEKNKRELGYSVTSISSDELNKTKEPNLIQALQGKVPGLNVTSQSGNLGGSTRIVLRGVSSLNGNNQPLFVVDGIPVSNSNIVGGTTQERLNGAIDVGNRGSDLNPSDIQEVTVLKGAAAAALYGQRARNGAIIITTKKGSNQGANVKISSTVKLQSPLKLPDFQNEYGPGDMGKYDETQINGWGPKIKGQEVPNFRGDTVSLQAYPDNIRNFYRNAATAINSVSLSGGSKNSDYRLGFTRQDQGGIIPNSKLSKNTITFNMGNDFTDELSSRISGSYVNTSMHGKAVQGGNDPNVLTSLINTLPRTTNFDSLSDYENADGSQRKIGSTVNNPYWITNKNVYSSSINRLFGSGILKYNPNQHFGVKLRVGTDLYTEERKNINAKGTVGNEKGEYSQNIIQNSQVDGDLTANYDRNFSEDFSFKAIAGLNVNARKVKIQNNLAENLTVPGLYNFSNATANTPSNLLSKRRLIGIYGDVTLGYKDYLFLELTGRNDISSTLPKDNRSYFYPSASLSYIFTDGLDIDSDVLTYGKFRINYAVVGNDAAPYQLDFTFEPVSSFFGQFGTDNTFPYGGQVGFEGPGTLPPTNLKPEKTHSFEVGTELQFYDGRLGLDLTYYNITTKNEILDVPIPQTTGYAANRKNIGQVSNNGIEIGLNTTPIRTQNFDWSSDINFSKNVNRVDKLAEGLDEITISSTYNDLQVKAEPGKSFGLYGVAFKRDSTGELLINSDTGLRQAGKVKRLGSINHDFKVGFNNSFNYKNLGFSFLIDWKQGGVVYSETVRTLRYYGVADETLENRNGTFIDKGVIAKQDNDGNTLSTRPNDVPVQSMESFWQRYSDGSIAEGSVFPATYVKLREVKLSYSLSRTTIENTPFSDISVSLVGRNLFLLYSEVPHIDPETGLLGSASNGQGVEYNNLPSVRSFGLNVSLSL